VIACITSDTLLTSLAVLGVFLAGYVLGLAARDV
jgi:hypothetical protein